MVGYAIGICKGKLFEQVYFLWLLISLAVGKCILRGGLHPFPPRRSFLLITPIAVLRRKPRWGAGTVVFDWVMDRAEIVRGCSRSGVDVLVPCSPPSAAAAGWEAVVAWAGVLVGTLAAAGPSVSGSRPFGLCPKFLKNRRNRWQSRLRQAKMKGVFPPSQILCLLSSLQA